MKWFAYGLLFALVTLAAFACGGTADGGPCTWKGGKCEIALKEMDEELQDIDEADFDPGSVAPSDGGSRRCHWDHGRRHGRGPKYHCHGGKKK